MTDCGKCVSLSVCVSVWPNGLCIDYTRDHLYWADAKLDRVEMSDVNGQHRVVLVRGIHQPFALAVVTILCLQTRCSMFIFDSFTYWLLSKLMFITALP